MFLEYGFWSFRFANAEPQYAYYRLEDKPEIIRLECDKLLRDMGFKELTAATPHKSRFGDDCYIVPIHKTMSFGL